ncbi:ABC transporter ATP-binding protein [Rhodococcus sp. 14-2483-1-1]|uniref:ABC transporter ATP-binding protein n=1 Tax=Rhodococcus sp. 14-2483-1-1 TaxID=2023148 RepID=UPI000B9C1AD2|nr:ATP-binding cassette domain-containing protein [Rhodococcus sp. 14-2483-1-1]OZF36875.1 ABC transporter ATP-binding protein [Rhodococcus sp. 14-2483-1-1]
MTEQPVVSFDGLTKTFGSTTAVEDVTFDVMPGRIVGLLGRNGAGKTTTLRMLLGLAEPTSGKATVFGSSFGELRGAARRIGVSMDGSRPIPGASGERELTILARALGIGRARVDEVLELVGLTGHEKQKVTKYSTGMRQRLSLAAALLSDPELLILDEPTNGLDPDGIRWLREFLTDFAARGRTVLLSSHMLSEVQQTVDDVAIISTSLLYSGTLNELTSRGRDRLEDRFFELVGAGTGGAQ